LLRRSSDLPGGLAHRAGTHPPKWRIPSLFGLAPCGVYPATAFTDGAVRSYRTFSPLPRAIKPGAVCSLWHWPSLSLDAQIPDVIRHTALRSSDFPLPKHVSAPAATARRTCNLYASPYCQVCKQQAPEKTTPNPGFVVQSRHFSGLLSRPEDFERLGRDRFR
jgi:hypothetical protein